MANLSLKRQLTAMSGYLISDLAKMSPARRCAARTRTGHSSLLGTFARRGSTKYSKRGIRRQRPMAGRNIDGAGGDTGGPEARSRGEGVGPKYIRCSSSTALRAAGVGPASRPSVLYRLGIRLITFNRPGYGDSDRQPGRTIASGAADVAAIADRLGIETLRRRGTFGRGSTPSRARVVTRPGHPGGRAGRPGALRADGLDWFDGMTASTCASSPWPGWVSPPSPPASGRRRAQIRADPASKISGLALEAPVRPSHGRRHRHPPHAAAQLRRRAARLQRRLGRRRPRVLLRLDLRSGGDPGPDAALARRERRVLPGQPRPVAGTAHSGSTLRIERGVAHFGALDILPDVLVWLTQD